MHLNTKSINWKTNKNLLDYIVWKAILSIIIILSINDNDFLLLKRMPTIKSKCANTKTKYQIVFVLFAAVWKTIERKNKKEKRSKRQIIKTQSFCKLFDTEKQYDIEVQITFIYIEKVSKKKPHIKTQ